MKKSHPIIDMLLGILIALVAAGVYSIIISWDAFALHKPEDVVLLFLVVPLFGLLYTFWFVIPLGAALGVIIPEVVRDKSRFVGAFIGAVFGIAVGLMIGLLIALINMGTENWFLSLIGYCAAWTGTYAAIRARGTYRYR